ncbi:SCO6745 family protein [Actinomycetospora sp. CA-084318]|uniref:SCO6745 family protein n=1 Tax=Actinomycetospora sp. CA-084318 TaxID=3239892 RepID=UPI003D95E50D
MPAATSPARRLRDAIEPIAMVYVHSAEAREQYEAIGLERFQGYVLGRAGALGLPPASLVVATFGVFEPETLAGTYEAALATASVQDALAAKLAGATRCLHRVFGEPARDVEEVVTVLRGGLDRAPVLGKALFAGHAAMAWPGDAWARLWHATNLLREYRGDAHLAALVSHGISALESNLLTEARVGMAGRDYTRTRAWSEEDIEAATADLLDRLLITRDGDRIRLTERGAALRDDVEDATEAALDPVIEGMEHGLDLVVERCLRWSRELRDGGAFPDDDEKLQAG